MALFHPGKLTIFYSQCINMPVINHFPPVNWIGHTARATLSCLQEEMRYFFCGRYRELILHQKNVFTDESASCSVNKTFKAWAFIQKDHVAYWRPCHDLYPPCKPSSRRTTAGRDLGRPWGWGEGAGEWGAWSQGTLCFPNFLFLTPSPLHREPQMVITSTFPQLSHAVACLLATVSPFPPYAGSPCRESHDPATRKRQGWRWEGNFKGFPLLAAPHVWDREGHRVCRQMCLGQEGVTRSPFPWCTPALSKWAGKRFSFTSLIPSCASGVCLPLVHKAIC